MNIRTVTDCKRDNVLLVKNIFVQTDTKPFYLPHNQMSTRAMIVPIFTFLVVISSRVHRSLQITDDEYPLMHFTIFINEENFTPELPLVAVLPQRQKTKLIWKWDI